MFVNFHNSSLVTAAVTVVWCTEDGHNIMLLTPAVALRYRLKVNMSIVRYIHDKLVSPRNERQAVVVVKRAGNVLSESIPSATWRNTPAHAIVGIGPQEVTHRAFVRDFLVAVKRANMVERVNGRRKATM